jgi:protein-disulfide isomerase
MKTKPPAKKLSKQVITVVIVAIAIALVAGIKFLKWNGVKTGQTAIVRTQGKLGAPIKITEWVDFQCPACASGATDLKNYFSGLPDKFYLEVKYFPLGGHVHSLEAAKFAECSARQGKFWPYYEQAFERQPKWRDLFDARPVFDEIAKDIGDDAAKLQACIQSDDVRDVILKEKDVGAKLGIQSTPTYFVNGKMVVGPKLMREEVERILSGKPEATPAPAP